MLSPDLAELYGVQPKVLVQAVKRNAARFPEDFILNPACCSDCCDEPAFPHE